MSSPTKLQEAVQWLGHNMTFNIDQRVHLFEVNIRVLGTLSTAKRCSHCTLSTQALLLYNRICCCHLSSNKAQAECSSIFFCFMQFNLCMNTKHHIAYTDV